MKMEKFFIILIGVSLLAISGCNKQMDDLGVVESETKKVEYFVPAEEPEFTNTYDYQLNELAKALNRAVQASSGVRVFVRSEVLRRFDGDYDFLIDDAINKKVIFSDERLVTRSGQTERSFGEIIRDYLPMTKSGNDLLTELQKQYPDLQIAVPIHATEWDPETFVPVVAFIPDGYDDSNPLPVPGYDANGNYVKVDAISVPDVPVIVLSRNERYGRPLVLTEVIDTSDIPDISAPTNLTAITSGSSIALSWNYSGQASGYYVWRKAIDNDSFEQIAILNGPYNMAYQDRDVVVGATYYYYVTAFNLVGFSAPSNIVSAVGPEVVSSLTSFSVTPSGYDLEFDWTHGQAPFADVIIEKKGPYDSGYSTLTRITDWTTNYLYRPSVRGLRHNYRIYRENGNSQSDALKDFIYPPFRNTNAPSYVYIKKIEYPLGLEGWLRGDAEFEIFVTSYNEITHSVQVDSAFVTTPSGADISVFLKDWRCHNAETDWYSVISIHIVEQDLGDEITYEFDVKSSTKLFDVIGVNVAARYKGKIKDEDDVCGSRDLYYYDNPGISLQFPSEGVKITLSENS